MPGKAPQVNLDAELVAAMERVRGVGEPMPAQFAKFGFSRKFGAWGVGRVRFDSSGLYEPDPDTGEKAWIVGVCAGGDLVDLAAFRGRDHEAATRLGDGVALGLDLLEENRWFENRVTRVFSDVFDWLSDPTGGIYVFNLRRAREVFDRRDVLYCGTPEFEARLRRSLWVQPDMPRFVLAAAARRAA